MLQRVCMWIWLSLMWLEEAAWPRAFCLERVNKKLLVFALKELTKSFWFSSWRSQQKAFGFRLELVNKKLLVFVLKESTKSFWFSPWRSQQKASGFCFEELTKSFWFSSWISQQKASGFCLEELTKSFWIFVLNKLTKSSLPSSNWESPGKRLQSRDYLGTERKISGFRSLLFF